MYQHYASPEARGADPSTYMGPNELAAWRALEASLEAWHANPTDELWAIVDAAWATYHQTEG